MTPKETVTPLKIGHDLNIHRDNKRTLLSNHSMHGKPVRSLTC